MVYVIAKQEAKHNQVTWEDILFERTIENKFIPYDSTGTITRVKQYTIIENTALSSYVRIFADFVKKYEVLYKIERHALYNTFYIPKRSGGLRRIDAPKTELMRALNELKWIFEKILPMPFHTAAFAYAKGRCCTDAIKRHQRNKSEWFLKTDFSDFFGSTTIDFVMSMIENIHPFNHLVSENKEIIRKAIDLAFLNGGLPQGTPISPLITNLMMVPIDHRLYNELAKKNFVYTRYADDILISARSKFEYKEIVEMIGNVLKEFNAPFEIKDKKTRFGSKNGSNWNLGLVLNKDNNITVGHMNKKYFKAALNNFLNDYLNKKPWSAEDTMRLAGTIAHYKSIEPEYFNYVIDHMDQKYHTETQAIIKKILTNG